MDMSDRSNLEKLKDITQYRVLKETYIEEMNSQGVILEHVKSGARIFLMSNDDDNKVFCIGFRTPPEDSSGLPHILEHSVLEDVYKRQVLHFKRCIRTTGRRGHLRVRGERR